MHDNDSVLLAQHTAKFSPSARSSSSSWSIAGLGTLGSAYLLEYVLGPGTLRGAPGALTILYALGPIASNTMGEALIGPRSYARLSHTTLRAAASASLSAAQRKTVMRQGLCHVPLPATPATAYPLCAISNRWETLTGLLLDSKLTTAPTLVSVSVPHCKQ
jgi:hypothetical protein